MVKAVGVLALLAIGCDLVGGTETCVNGAVRRDGDCVFVDGGADGGGPSDAGDGDGDADAGFPDASTDAAMPQCITPSQCGADLPSCVDGACSACSVDNDCLRFAGDSRGACGALGACVECNANEDCSTEASPRCGADNRCTACVEDTDCSPFGKVCDAGECVQCTGTKVTACGGDVCDSQQRLCADGVLPRSSDLCQPCVSDLHCPTDALCMPTSFGGEETGYFCLPKRAVGESCINDHRPFASTVNAGTGDAVSSIDEVVEPVCRLALTTCQALNDFRGTSCTDTSDDDACGIPGLEDGICAPVPSDTVFLCSAPCLSERDCKPGSTCTGSGHCSL